MQSMLLTRFLLENKYKSLHLFHLIYIAQTFRDQKCETKHAFYTILFKYVVLNIFYKKKPLYKRLLKYP